VPRFFAMTAPSKRNSPLTTGASCNQRAGRNPMNGLSIKIGDGGPLAPARNPVNFHNSWGSISLQKLCKKRIRRISKDAKAPVFSAFLPLSHRETDPGTSAIVSLQINHQQLFPIDPKRNLLASCRCRIHSRRIERQRSLKVVPPRDWNTVFRLFSV
jgi:hypothetical protein